MKLQLLVIEI